MISPRKSPPNLLACEKSPIPLLDSEIRENPRFLPCWDVQSIKSVKIWCKGGETNPYLVNTCLYYVMLFSNFFLFQTMISPRTRPRTCLHVKSPRYPLLDSEIRENPRFLPCWDVQSIKSVKIWCKGGETNPYLVNTCLYYVMLFSNFFIFQRSKSRKNRPRPRPCVKRPHTPAKSRNPDLRTGCGQIYQICGFADFCPEGDETSKTSPSDLPDLPIFASKVTKCPFCNLRQANLLHFSQVSLE